MLTYITQNYIEIAGTILSLIYIFLSIRQRSSMWIFGFLCSLLYIVVFFRSKFYADMSLQFYYLFISIYGWISWKTGKARQGKELPVKNTNRKQAFYLTLASIAIFLLYYFVLSEYTDSPLPLADSFTTALSIIATWMLAKKMIEHWILWWVIDGLSAGLYIYKGLYSTSALFLVYTVMAVIGFAQWRKAIRDSSEHLS